MKTTEMHKPYRPRVGTTRMTSKKTSPKCWSERKVHGVRRLLPEVLRLAAQILSARRLVPEVLRLEVQVSTT